MSTAALALAVVLLACVRPLGLYMSEVFAGRAWVARAGATRRRAWRVPAALLSGACGR